MTNPVHHETVFIGSSEQRYQGALATVLVEISDIRADRRSL